MKALLILWALWLAFPMESVAIILLCLSVAYLAAVLSVCLMRL